MNIAEIRRLVKLVETSTISELEIEQEGIKVRIAKGATGDGLAPSRIPVAMAPQQAAFSAEPTGAPNPAGVAGLTESRSNLVEVTSPMVGTFYRAPSPEAPPYIQVGDNIRPGQVLCIIEAMKLMNEIEGEHSGRIKEIAVENAEPVEFGQLLFRIEPD